LRMIVFGLVTLLVLSGGVAVLWTVLTVQHIADRTSAMFVTPAPVRPASGGSAEATAVPVTFPDWSKKEPVNILLIGLDYRPQEEGSRADTQIVVHIDPANKTAIMLSIPRDLWVTIPGYGEGRVNEAYLHGERDNVPGGGPGLSMATIEENFGIPIHYFAQVNFTGFERVVDSIGGVTIDVPRPLVDNEYPLANEGVTRVYIPAGLQHMDGRTALEYARSRHADSDLGRNSRQQQVLLAVRQQGLNLNLITKLSDIVDQASDAVKTDLSFVQVGSLAQLAKDIDTNSIQTVLIDADMVNEAVLPSGADVLMPRWDLIKPKIVQAFADPKLAKEDARISVQNGTNTGGMARKTADELAKEGLFVTEVVSARNQGQHPATTVTDYTGGQKPRTIEALSKALDLNRSSIEEGNPADAPVSQVDGKPLDIVVIVGDDRIGKTTTTAP
jgi:LCP family protein required for cell wall assembly